MTWNEYQTDKEHYDNLIARVTEEELKPSVQECAELIEAQRN